MQVSNGSKRLPTRRSSRRTRSSTRNTTPSLPTPSTTSSGRKRRAPRSAVADVVNDAEVLREPFKRRRRGSGASINADAPEKTSPGDSTPPAASATVRRSTRQTRASSSASGVASASGQLRREQRPVPSKSATGPGRSPSARGSGRSGKARGGGSEKTSGTVLRSAEGGIAAAAVAAQDAEAGDGEYPPRPVPADDDGDVRMDASHARPLQPASVLFSSSSSSSAASASPSSASPASTTLAAPPVLDDLSLAGVVVRSGRAEPGGPDWPKIATTFGVAEGVVRERWAELSARQSKLEAASNGRKWQQEEDDKVLRLIGNGMTPHEAAFHLGRGATSVRSRWALLSRRARESEYTLSVAPREEERQGTGRTRRQRRAKTEHSMVGVAASAAAAVATPSSSSSSSSPSSSSAASHAQPLGGNTVTPAPMVPGLGEHDPEMPITHLINLVARKRPQMKEKTTGDMMNHRKVDGKFTPLEALLLSRLRMMGLTHKQVATVMKRTETSVRAQWTSMASHVNVYPKRFSEEEDDQLSRLCMGKTNVDWQAVSLQFPGRSALVLRDRWHLEHLKGQRSSLQQPGSLIMSQTANVPWTTLEQRTVSEFVSARVLELAENVRWQLVADHLPAPPARQKQARHRRSAEEVRVFLLEQLNSPVPPVRDASPATQRLKTTGPAVPCGRFGSIFYWIDGEDTLLAHAFLQRLGQHPTTPRHWTDNDWDRVASWVPSRFGSECRARYHVLSSMPWSEQELGILQNIVARVGVDNSQLGHPPPDLPSQLPRHSYTECLFMWCKLRLMSVQGREAS